MKVNYDRDLSQETKNNIINDYTNNFLSLKEIMLKYNVKSKEYLCKKLLKDVLRNFSESVKIAHNKFPERYKQSDEAKNKIRTARLKFLKEHPEQTAWRTKNMSYPEKCFKKLLEKYDIDQKFLIYREYSVFPYFIDFAFIDIKVAVEIDGSQHLEEDRKKSDEEKDKLLLANGWKILRFTATEVIHNQQNVYDKLLYFIKGNKNFEKVGILKAPKKYQKVERDKDGYSEKQKKLFYKNRKVKNRPNKDELWEMICNESFEALGRKYGVNANTIKKWCKNYNIPYRKKDIDAIINKTHKYSKKIIVCKNCGKTFVSDKQQKFCKKECFTEYIRKNYKNVYCNNIRNRHICKIDSNGNIIRKRVSTEELETFLKNGWKQGRKI